MPTFGYTTGTGGAVNLSSGQMGSQFTNTTGGRVYITQFDLLNVTTARTATHQCAVYTDEDGLPGILMGVSDILSSVAVGTNTFAVSGDPIGVEDGQTVWLFVRAATTLSASGVGATDALIRAWTAGSSAFSGTFMLSGGLADNIVPLTVTGSATDPGTSNVEVPMMVQEVASQGVPSVQVPLIVQEAMSEGMPTVQVPLITQDVLSEGYPNVQIALLVQESLHPVPPELPMSTIPFPGFGNSASDPAVPAGASPFNTDLPGLAFSVHKRPMFNTNIKEAPSGSEVRNALAQYPRWEFELTYEFLEDRSGADSSLKTIMGFFLARQGSFDSWLFKDPDDYLVTNGYCGTTDGVTTQFPFCRTMGEFHEKVGQVDTVNTITLYLSIDEAGTIPATPGPYTITVAEAATFVEDLGVTKGGTPLTRVASAPAASQYSVNETTGVYTFSATDESDAVVISYRYEIDPLDYTVTLPNLVVFDSAPPTGTLTADFQFYFACRFLEDTLDFEKFYDKLWNLNECSFKSVIQ